MFDNRNSLTNTETGETVPGMRKWLIGDAKQPGVLVRKGVSVDQLANPGLRRKVTVGELAPAGEMPALRTVSRTALYQYINGDHIPTRETLQRLCDVLNEPIESALQYVTPKEKSGRPRGSFKKK